MRSQKGITLVALVVTIIVLLILAGVTIALVLGQDGIFSKAQTAASETNEQEFLQTVQLILLNMKVDSYEDDGTASTDNALPDTAEAAATKVQQILVSNYGFSATDVPAPSSSPDLVYKGTVTVTISGSKATSYTAALKSE